MAGLKTLAKELQSKGRNGDTMLAHINPQEAGILKALGGSGTINPDTGLPEYFVKQIKRGFAAANPFNPGSGLNKTINTIPVVGDINKAANKLGTQVFQPIEKAIVQPASKGLSEFDKQVARTIPGGWGTVAQVAASMVPGGQPLAVGIGAARGAGLLRTGSSLQRANLQGAVIGGATAYAQSELGDYMRGAVPPGTEGVTESLTEAVAREAAPELLNSVPYEGAVSQAGYYPSVDPGYYDVPSTMSTSPNFDPGYADVSSSVNVPPPPPPPVVVATPPLVQLGGPGTTGYTVTDYLKSGDLGAAANQVGSNIYDTGANALQNVQDFGNKVITPETYTEGIPNVLGKGYEGVSNTASGAKNLLGLGDISRNEAIKLAAKTGIDPIKMAGIVIAGESTLAGMEEQRKYLEEAKRANAISQAEYDRAMASINSQRDYAADVVSKNQFNPNPNRDVSIGETFYRRGDENESLYGRAPTSGSTLYAMGGQVDDELGGDYSAMGMDQGNLQKGLFGMGYAAGGQIDMGNGYNPFANLPSMGGPLGAVGQTPAGGFNPFSPERMTALRNDPKFLEMQRVQGGGRDEQGRTVDGLGNVLERTAPSGQSFGQTMSGLSSMFNQSAPQMSPSLDQNPNTNTGGFASPSSFYGGGGGSGLASYGGGNNNAFPLEGQYGIVKMAAGGMPPRFLSGGGDGMSDSIKATINDNQPARLADGEFVIPADVVSHLGNGSSKAGAKQLYSMMNKIRKARTGNSKQGKQINPRKYLPA